MTDSERLVDDAQSLAAVVDAIAGEPVVALDTEFVREQTYYPRLCLIQIATPQRLACVDCLADTQLDPLFCALFEPGRTWLLHSVRQDLEAMQRFTDRMPSRLIDTQIAAALLGRAPQIGLQAILAEELNVKLDKEFTRTNWAARPLPGGALRYALDDVRHLFDLWRVLQAKLTDLDRLAWLEEDCRTALETPVLTPPLALWSRLKGARAMDTATRCAALALVRWRERCAQRLDRPRRWVLSDELLVRIARASPDRKDDLGGIPEVPKRLVKRFGGEIVSAVAGSGNPVDVGLANKPQAPMDGAELKQLRERAKRRAGELNIDPQVLATRRELAELAGGRPTGRVATGWRWNELKGLV